MVCGFVQEVSPIYLASLQGLQNRPKFNRIKGLLIVHERETQGLIILFGLLYNLPHCVDVVYSAVFAPKPSLFQWFEFSEFSRKTVRDYSWKQFIDMA
jgi:hypothetical protein